MSFNLGYVSTTLTANGVSSGTFAWTITNGTSKAQFENGSTAITKTNINTVGVGSTSYSTYADDVTVQLQYTPASGPAVTTEYSFSIDSPYELAAGPIDDRGVTESCELDAPYGSDGFQTLLSYTIFSFFGVQITNIDVNETFSNWGSDYIGENWPVPDATPGTVSSSFADEMCAVYQDNPLSIDPQSPLLTIKVDHATQAFFVGSLDEASGMEVQSDTFQLYQDHGRHNPIVSPVR